MKTYNVINNWKILLMTLLISACADESPGPVLPDSDTFVAPVMENPATADEKILTAETSEDMFEAFEWSEADYGDISLSTNYVLEVDDDADFSSPLNLFESATATSTEITVGDFNDALLALGLTPNEAGTVNIRVRSTITGQAADTLYSNVIERTATNYKAGDCGNHCTIGLIGNATPGGWDIDTDLHLVDAATDKYTWATTLYLAAGEAKFRASDDWAENWGAAGFPAGTGVQDGANIPISEAGYYRVTFNDVTGDYSFTLLNTPTYTSIGVIGSGTAGGWDSDQDLTQDDSDDHVWTGTFTFTDGEAKFRANDAWNNNWGGTGYPSGTGVQDGPNIPVVAGTYFVRLNDATGEYMIIATNRSQPYAQLGVIGSATPGGWDNDTDMTQNPANPFLWSKIMTLTQAEAKFRADDAWTVNWGGSTFPSGKGTQDGPNIATQSGSYFITFNSGTGEYSFLK
jgi:hypothetical protein